MNPSQTAAPLSQLTPITAWSRRVRRIGGFIQLAFATFWLVRGALTIGGTAGLVLACASAVTALAVAVYGIEVTAAVAPPPTGAEAGRIGREITVSTVVQLVASFAAPFLLIAAGQPAWVLPAVAITIGLQLLWLGHRVHLPRYYWTGSALTVGPVLATPALSGDVLAATVGIGAGSLLLATAMAGFHDLATLRTQTAARGSTRPYPKRPRITASGRGTGPQTSREETLQ